MTRYRIGAGGWTYFQVPGVHPLVAYSKAFDFVEVNSTFYETPPRKRVESWRKSVPSNFEFAVRCNKAVTHIHRFKPSPRAFEALEQMTTICHILDAEILHLQTPKTFHPTKNNAERIRTFFASAKMRGIRVALEIRSQRPFSNALIQTMQDFEMIHSVDLSKDEEPAFKSDIVYTRLFGKGPHNIYQPSDEELGKIGGKAAQGNPSKVAFSFHFVRMYQDAARFKVYRETGTFPSVTRSTGVHSLAEILREDAKFPSSKEELVRRQGWKLFDLKSSEREKASYLLKQLPEKTYNSVDEVVQSLEADHVWRR